MRKFSLVLALMLAVGVASATARSIYDFTIKSIDGQPVKLKSYHGKVVLLVNVASKCGFTPQYAGLEAVYEKYKDRGLVIVGVPANNFAQQEPGTNEEIKKFCSNKYNVSFPMMAKVSVLGDDKAPLYQFLTDKSVNPSIGGGRGATGSAAANALLASSTLVAAPTAATSFFVDAMSLPVIVCR